MKVGLLKESPEARRYLEDELNRVEHLKSFEIRILTGSIVLFYDCGKVHPERLINLTAKALQKESGGLDLERRSNLLSIATLRSASSQVLSVLSPGSLWNLVGLSAVLAYRWTRNLLSAAPLPQNLSSLTGVAASVGTLSLAWQSVREIRNRGVFGLYPFLSAACGLAIFLGEAATALEILWVLSIASFVERLITERSRRRISDLLGVSPGTVYVLVEGIEVETPVERLRVGDTVVVHDGERIPVDGGVVRGNALVDESHITGCSEPELREVNDAVYAGTRVVQGALFICAQKVGRDTYLSSILRLVEDSLAIPAEVEAKADELAVRLVRFGALSTVATLLVTQSVPRALSVLLVMSCPCATVLATSTALAAAIANAARGGILVKGGRSLESVQKVDTVVFDKTGTLTLETPEVLEVIPRAPWQEPEQVLGMAANAEMGGRHPMARALLSAAVNQNISLEKNIESEVVLGRGVRARWDSEEVLVGNGPFMMDRNVNPSYYRAKATKCENAGHSVIYVARNGRLQGMIVLGNQLRPGCDAVIERLRQGGIERVLLVSGDAEPIVRQIAESLGIHEYRGELLPDQKAEIIDGLQQSGKRVMMVGDGLNDALALSRATVGVAMGAGGSEVAIEAADIALLSNDLEGLVHLQYLSRRSLEVIDQNFWIATATNVMGAVLGMLGMIPPVAAGLLHFAHSVGIMLNSSRLLVVQSTMEPKAGFVTQNHGAGIRTSSMGRIFSQR
jgi:cation-transporting P-type ATPase C